MVKAVIFDFDGVIADSEPSHFAATNKVLEQFGVQLDKDEYYTSYLGYTDTQMFEAVRDKFELNIDTPQIEMLIDQKGIFFEQLIRHAEHLIEGIPQFIKMLNTGGIKIGIYSGASRDDIELMLEGSDFADCFDVIVCAEDVEKGKPDPEGYLKALELTNKKNHSEIQADQCIVIEDSQWGINAAKKAGMRIIGITNSYPADELEDADLIIDSVSDLTISDLERLCE
ncbi:MAG: HAD family phosphatase [Planctomycetaceae bacterium]|nr:HAD family phosphatase [Planctomycetaceae bacterium]